MRVRLISLGLAAFWSGGLAGASTHPAPSQLLAECRRATMDIKALSDFSFEEPKWPPPLGAPRIRKALFLLTHYQISSRICDAAQRGSFENPAHVVKFNSRFVAMAVAASSKTFDELNGTAWGKAMAVCEDDSAQSGVGGVERCAYAMVEAHIGNDMPIVFNQVGCGSKRDWNYLFESIIKPSVEEAAKYVATTTGEGRLAAAPSVDAFSAYIVKLWRNKMRQQADCQD